MNFDMPGPLPEPSRQYRISLTVGDHSPRHLRRIARAHLRVWELPHLADPVELVLSELTTNVYRHVPDRRCTVTLLHTLDGVRLEVYDRDPVVPVLRSVPAFVEHGRGLALVDLLAGKWDVTLHRIGKTVWCEFAT